MAKTVEYDDRELQRMFAELGSKQRLQAVRAGFRKAAYRLRREAVKNLRAARGKSDRNLEKGVRALVFKRKAGFRVTVGTKRANKKGKGAAGFHTNRRGEEKPVLIWMEDGTRYRKTKGRWGSKPRRTGYMERIGFIDKAVREKKESITADLHNLVADSVMKTAKKYGCK